MTPVLTALERKSIDDALLVNETLDTSEHLISLLELSQSIDCKLEPFFGSKKDPMSRAEIVKLVKSAEVDLEALEGWRTMPAHARTAGDVLRTYSLTQLFRPDKSLVEYAHALAQSGVVTLEDLISKRESALFRKHPTSRRNRAMIRRKLKTLVLSFAD